jgi:hypothetical protein
MLAKHGVATGDDVSKLLTPLSQLLMSLSDLPKHMSTFLLASQRLTRSGQGETAYNYFKLFLETVFGFPSVGMCLTTYYSAYPAIINQSLVTLFPHPENMKDYLLKSDPRTPFSGSAQHGGTKSQHRNNRNKGSTKGNKQTAQANPRTQARTPRWSPHGPTLLAATPAPAPATTTDYAPYVAEIQRLQGSVGVVLARGDKGWLGFRAMRMIWLRVGNIANAMCWGINPLSLEHEGRSSIFYCARAMLTAQAQSPYQDAQFSMPVPSQPATMFSASRPREFYCWLHGWNNTHLGSTCKIMGSNTAYTHGMKTATGPENTGGNPKVGVPVHIHRPSYF